MVDREGWAVGGEGGLPVYWKDEEEQRGGGDGGEVRGSTLVSNSGNVLSGDNQLTLTAICTLYRTVY